MQLKAILLVALGVTCFGVIDGLAKLLAGDLSVLQIVWGRYAVAIPVVLAAAPPRTWSTLFATARPALQAARALLPLLASVAVVIGLPLMPLAEFTVISFAAPLLVVALSAPLLKERVTIHSWIGVLIGFAGVLAIVRPGGDVVVWAAVFPLTLAFLFALYQVLTRLVSRDDDPMVSLAWVIAAGVLLTTPLLPLGWNGVSAANWALLILSGLLFGMAHLLLVRAFGMAPASMLTPFTYFQIVAAVIFGAFVFGDLPDLWTVAGSAIIVLAGLYVLRRRQR